MKKLIIQSLIVSMSIFSSSCAFILSGTKDTIHIKNGNPNNAKVYYNGSLIGTSPCSVKIPKKSLGTATVRVEADGYKPQEIKFTRKLKMGAVIADCITGFVWLIPDFLTGAIYKSSPQRVHYDLSISENFIKTDLKVGDTVIFSNNEFNNAEGIIKVLYPNRTVITYVKKNGKEIELEIPLINVAKKQ